MFVVAADAVVVDVVAVAADVAGVVVVAVAAVFLYCSHSSQTLILQVNETEMTNTYTCKTESTTDCTSTTRPDCKTISWQECR